MSYLQGFTSKENQLPSYEVRVYIDFGNLLIWELDGVTHTHISTHTYVHIHARTHAHTHTHTLYIYIYICILAYICPGGNATDPIWRVLASSQGISSRTPLKPQQSNPNPYRLANQLWCVNFLTPPTPLTIPHRLPGFFESVIPLKKLMLDSCKMVEKQSEAFHTFLWHFFQV